MVKKRNSDFRQNLQSSMPVKDSVSVKQEIIDVEENQRRPGKDGYSRQSGWGRELRNRFVFSSNDHSRNTGDSTMRSRYSEQESAIPPRRRHIRSCRVSVSLDERGRVYEEDEMMEDSDDIGMFDDGDDDNDDIFTPVKQRERGQRRSNRRLRSSLTLEHKPGPSRAAGRGHETRSRTRMMGEQDEDLGCRDGDYGEELVRQMNGHDSSIEKLVANNHESEGVRRSTRQRKLLYDNFNTSWILGTQTLRGYPMYLAGKETSPHKGGEGDCPVPCDDVRVVDEEGDDGKDSALKKRRRIEQLEPPPVVDNTYEDMYSRVKRPRQPVQRLLFNSQRPKTRSGKLLDTDDDASDTSSDSTFGRDACRGGSVRRQKYHLRKTKPIVDRFQANVDPPRRSSRILRSVLCSSVRRHRHRKLSSSSSSSDEHFEKTTKSRNRCVPVNYSPSGHSRPSDIKKLAPTLADVDPMALDKDILFKHVGGLESHILCLKEMVVFPILYREIFDKFHIKPPKGVLFHGPPGTGKTLIARALANECSQGDRKVSFFMRKGADCLSKWVGESERQLRLLFDQAYQMRPSIIFFDEIDGLAPVRSTKQDQIHASIVSTLLALMDGIDNRGDVIVIGATNRIDAIDPALRRPGRFDRELFFPLPARKERQEILRIHVDQWESPPSPVLIAQLADQAVGYCGSDLRALCTEAVIQALKRRYPQIYRSSQKLLLDPDAVKVDRRDFIRAKCHIVPASRRVSQSPGRRLSSMLEPLLKCTLDSLTTILKENFPHGVSSPHSHWSRRPVHHARLLLAGSSPAQGQTLHLGPALLHRMEHVAVHRLDLATLYEVSGRGPEEACIQLFHEVCRNLPAIIYIPKISQWWHLAPESVHAIFLSQVQNLDPTLPILLLGTSDVPYSSLPRQVCSLFSQYRGEVFTIQNPPAASREAFFAPLLLVESIRPPKLPKRLEPMEELPLAPPPQPPKLSEKELQELYEKEEVSLSELRIFLRQICAKLARNRQFFMFTKPVDVEEVPDYLSIVKEPMDLETMMTKIDLHQYTCAKDFLDDVDLVCQNALAYNPDRDPADKLIRHRACSLRDTAYTLIKAEMNSDFEEKCREISRSRKQRAVSPMRFAPEFLRTNMQTANLRAGNYQPVQTDASKQSSSEPSKDVDTSPNQPVENNAATSPGAKKCAWRFGEHYRTKRRKSSFWARGELGCKKKKPRAHPSNTSENTAPVCITIKENGIEGSKQEKYLNIPNGVKVEVNHDLSADGITDPLNGRYPNGSFLSSNGKGKNRSPLGTDEGIADRIAFCDPKSPTNDRLSCHEDAADEWSSCDEATSQDDPSLIRCEITRQEGEAQTEYWRRRVEVSAEKLKQLLSQAVILTENRPVDMLVELYVQLSKCVTRHSRLWVRTDLPQELQRELLRFVDHNTAMNSNS
ncbi:ATPase family AAA domain-containing protein 2-like isoform X2 [Bacillus rossius redtenbacheri]|uniref:ATPase family AAA domain-containing protein 2-like isoform X2 n=1 Tax=Bacillus rossius redtenbacheri TaxID=93214 RepID=UPI002FDD6DAA